MSNQCHFGLEFLDVNAWQTRIWKDSVHHLSIFKLLDVALCHDKDLLSSSSLDDLASLVSSLFKMFKMTPFVMVSSLCVALYFWPFLSL
jgi:hypothetical protein